MWEVDKLAEYLNSVVTGSLPGDKQKDPKVRLLPDKSTFHCNVRLAPGVKLDLQEGDLHKLLGLDAKVYDTEHEKGSKIINIARGVDRIVVRCDLADKDHEQAHLRDTVFDLIPVAKPGEAMLHDVENIEFYKCKDEVIRRLKISITDMKGRPVEMTEDYSLKLVFRSR